MVARPSTTDVGVDSRSKLVMTRLQAMPASRTNVIQMLRPAPQRDIVQLASLEDRARQIALPRARSAFVKELVEAPPSTGKAPIAEAVLVAPITEPPPARAQQLALNTC